MKKRLRGRNAPGVNAHSPEIIDYVDDEDRVVSQGPRGEAWKAGLSFRVAATVLFEQGRERVLVYRRSANARPFGGHHDVLVGGAPRSGETYRQAAERELYEELGVRSSLQEALRLRVDTPVGPCHLMVHETESAVSIQRNPREVAHHVFLAPHQVLSQPPSPFVPMGLQVLRLLSAHTH
ncbi:NUDIX domain-containing protein [Streptomyces sp. NPDC087908]|uniref:NUDIX domain-containing protein n=1 Tax=Streptomyces sp. NPDC087908 TaxID=3365820 RepID=UPI0038146719